MPHFSQNRSSYSPHMHVLSSPLAMPHASASTMTPSIYRPSLSASPKREAYTPLMPLNHSAMELSAPSSSSFSGPSDTKLPSIGQLLLTPPNSTEMKREHSFSAYHDDHGAADHALFPSQHRRPPSQGSHDSSMPLFSPSPRGQSSSHFGPERGASGSSLPPIDPSRRGSDPRLHKYISSHQSQFQTRHPGSSAPNEDDYQLFVDFVGEIRSRPPPKSPQQRSPIVLQETSANSPAARHLAPQYAPYYPSSPSKRPSMVLHNSPDMDYTYEHDSARSGTPPKRARLDSEASASLEPDEPSPQPSRRRRSTQPSRKRGGNTSGALKETKHNRNRSTKEKKSTNFEDYPDMAPGFDTMQNPMEAARSVPEHKVNTRKELGSDPLREHLHEAEATVAQRLNIGCAEYLVFKRQVFEVYVRYLKEPVSGRGQWNKTRAQQAGNLDVGKASQIWVFWKNVGWFDETLFKDQA